MTIFLNQTSQTLKGTLLGGALGDFNNDGYIDIAYSIQNSKGPAIFLGRNGGGFNSNSLSFVNTTDIRSLGSADLNRDGIVDLIGPDLTSGNIYYFKGLGNGNFLAPTILGNVSNAYMMVLADLDKNGTTDIAVTTQSSSSVAIFYTNTSGSVVSTKSVSSGGAWDRGIDAADFNNDGYQDLVVTNVNNNVASVLYGPNFTTPTLLTTGIYPIGVVAADLNNDGRTDFVTTNHNANSNSISVFLNTVTGFSRTDISLGGYPDDRISAKDFNGDGYLDLAIIMVGSGLKVLLGNGTGTSYTSEFYSAVNIGPAQPLFFDQNKDGDLDIITSMVDGIYIFENNATPPTYKLSSSNTSVNEGSTATFTLTTTNVAPGTAVPYTLSGISTDDVLGNLLSGNAVVNSSGVATISVTLLNDSLTEGAETLILNLQGNSASILINDTSKSVATYSISANSTSANEGATATFILTTSNVAAGTSISYTISGISVADLASGSLTGISTVATNGQASITINLANDNLTEGTETLTVLAQGQTASTVVNDTSKSNTSTFPTVLTQQQMQNAPALAFTAFTSTDPAVKWNFSSFFFGTNLLGKDFNLTSFYGSASSIYDINALSIDDPDYLAIFDSSGNLITSSSEAKDWAAFVDSSGKSFDYDNISAWSPPKDGTYYLGVVLSQTSSTPFYSFGGYETRATVTSIPFGNGKYFYGSSGPDNVIGTSYVDVLKQSSTSVSNQLTKLADGSWQVQNKLTPSNTDNLVNVERVEFSDMSVALDVSGPAGQVAKILGSVFGPSYVNNTVFAGIGLAYLDGGMSYLDLCGLAAGAAGLSTPDLLVSTLLRNATGSEPTTLSKATYLQSISNGASYASVVQQIADSSVNTQSIKLTDIVKAGLAFTPYILPATYNVSATSPSVNEGLNAVFNLTTTNVSIGTEVTYTLSGINSSDVTTGLLTGKSIVGTGGLATISIPISSDGVTEGQETITISAQGATASIVINDTSKGNATPAYALTPATSTINEGVLAQVYVSTTNVAAGTSLQFGISGVGITQGDVIEGLSRFVTVDSTGKAVININTVADQLTEGPETMNITLGSSSTSIVINDTSVSLVGVINTEGGDGGGGGGGGGGAGGD